MKRIASIVLLLTSFMVQAKDEPGYQISVTMKGMANQKYYLGYYFGDKQYLRDSGTTDKTGKVVFKGNKPLEGGIYMLASAQKNLIFDFVVTEQVFSLETDSVDILKHMVVKGSPENEAFFGYTRFTTTHGGRAMQIEKEAKEAREKGDTAQLNKLTSEYKAITKELNEYRKKVETEHPTFLLSKIFRMIKDIDVPDAPKNAKGEIIDSNFQYMYYRNHYFDNFDWADERIVRTPVFHQKMENYLLKLTPQLPDTIIMAADAMLAKASAGKENFKYCLYWITNHYETSTYMGMDEVFVHMVDEYYAKGKAFWVDPTLLEKMKLRADQLRTNLLGVKATNLSMIDTGNVYHSLYNIKAKYTLLIFWDANCGKCKEEIPKLKTLYDELNTGKQTIKKFDVFAVSLTPDANDWIKYLKENKLKWLNVYDPHNETNFRHFYDIYSTPVLYLLDENKKIIAKRLGVDQLKGFMDDYDAGKVPF